MFFSDDRIVGLSFLYFKTRHPIRHRPRFGKTGHPGADAHGFEYLFVFQEFNVLFRRRYARLVNNHKIFRILLREFLSAGVEKHLHRGFEVHHMILDNPLQSFLTYANI